MTGVSVIMGIIIFVVLATRAIILVFNRWLIENQKIVEEQRRLSYETMRAVQQATPDPLPTKWQPDLVNGGAEDIESLRARLAEDPDLPLSQQWALHREIMCRQLGVEITRGVISPRPFRTAEPLRKEEPKAPDGSAAYLTDFITFGDIQSAAQADWTAAADPPTDSFGGGDSGGAGASGDW